MASGAPRVTLEPAALALAPGQSGDVDVQVQNRDAAVVFFTPELKGLPEEAVTFEPGLLRLPPDETGTFRLRVTVPERSRLMGGRYVLGVLVRSEHDRTIRRCEELRLDLAASPGLKLTPTPEAREAGAGSTTYDLRIDNEGNTGLKVRLRAADPKGVIGAVFRPSTVDVPAGASARTELTVSAPRPWTGQPRRHSITVQAEAGPDVRDQRLVTFDQKPRIAGGVLRVSAVAVAVLLGVAAVPVSAAIVVRSLQQQAPPVVPSIPALTAAAAPSSVAAAPSSAASSPAPPSQSPSVQPSANAAFPPGKPVGVDFAVLPDGTRYTDRIIPPDLYATAYGVVLSTVVDRAPAVCKDATGLALLRATVGGGFLTSSSLDNANLCNFVPVRVKLPVPAATVTVAYLGSGKPVQLVAEFADGTEQTVPGSAAADVADALSVRALAGKQIVAVVFGTATADPEKTGDEKTRIKKLTFVPA